MKNLTRWLRRRYWQARVRHHQAEIARLDELRQRIGPAIDRAICASNTARIELLMLDIHRPPVTAAQSAGPRDGKVRPIREAA